jgi:hypothetical protein
MILEVGEYLPDLSPFRNPGATIAKNVIPLTNSYGEFKGASVYSSNALGAFCRGAVGVRDDAGNTHNFASDQTALYKMSASAWSDVSLSAYSTANEGEWEFVQYDDFLLATNYVDYIQKFELSSDSAFSNLTTDLNARHLGVSRGFVIAGNTSDVTDGAVPNRVRWCALRDITDWTISSTTQADQQDLNSAYGWVQRVIGGDRVTIFQEDAIVVGTYVGSPLVWRFDEAETNRGLLVPRCALKIGRGIFYLAKDGFYLWDGAQSIPIGEGKVNKTFFDDFDFDYKHRVSVAQDVDKQIIYVSYPGSGNSSGRPNKMLMFNYAANATKRWSYAEIETEALFNSLAEGYTLDQLDSVSASLDALPFSLDSRVWMGDSLVLSAFNSDDKMVNMTGAALDAVVETQENEIFPNEDADLTLIRPLVEGTSATITMQVGTRQKQQDSVSYSSAVSPNTNGDCEVRENGRLFRGRINVSGGFDHIQGVDIVEAEAAGRR